MEELDIFKEAGIQIFDKTELSLMLIHFFFNLIMVWGLVHFLYFKKSRRRDYYFTFIIISISIFFLIFLLGSVKIKIGFALGLFAIFGIIRYRTESMPVREMTYLFAIIAMSIINALAINIGYAELLTANLLFILSIFVCESNRWIKHVSSKDIKYDKIDLIKPSCRQELIKDLKERTGLDIIRLEIGAIDFLKDTALIKIYYIPQNNEINTIDNACSNILKDEL